MRRKRLLSLLAILALLISLTVAIPIVHGEGPDDFTAPEKQEQQYPSLGSHLNQLVASVESGASTPQDAAANASIHSGGSVAVTIYLSGNVDGVVEFLEDNGGDPRNTGEDYIEAYVPVTLLPQLSQQPGVIRVREIIPPQPLYGPITSQGVQTHLAPAWHDAGYRGEGIKVGIIDVGFEGITSLIGSELPSIGGARCYSGIGVFSTNPADCENSSVHGTAVAETLVDTAPGVSIYIADGYSAIDLQEITQWMISEGVTVINYSVGWTFFGPGDGTSPYSNSPMLAVDQAATGGIIWVNSAGNAGYDNWFAEGSDLVINNGGWVEFATGKTTNCFTMWPQREYLIQMRWEDTWYQATRDLDLYLYDQASEEIVLSSEDFQVGEPGQDPWEGISFTYTGNNPSTACLMVRHLSGTRPEWVQVNDFYGTTLLEHITLSHSIGVPAESANPGMLAVGATHYWDTNIIASYSSRGPTIDGRIKPDIVGTACAEVASYPVLPPEYYGNNCWFPGTSQASPHVAGLAALVKQRFPDSTPAQVASYLKDNAEERGDPGLDNTWGHGFAVLPAPGTGSAPGACTEAITADGTFSGAWATGCDSEERDGRHARYYTFELAQASDVTITLERTSGNADTYLNLWQGANRTGTPVAFNDDSPDTSRSQITQTLAAGAYTVEATTFAAGETGAFTLAISGLGGSTTPPPSGDCDAQAITADGPVSGAWAAGCDSVDKAGSHARYYTFTLAQASDVTIGLESSADTYLYLRQGEAKSGTALHEDDDGGEGTNSRIQADGLAAGTYTIEATTYRAGETGSFTLTVTGLTGTTTPPPSGDCDAQAITADGPVSGTWAAGCDSVDKAGSHARYYTFTLAQASDVTIGLESTIDTYLYLRQGEAKSGTALHEDDDGGEGTNSRIQADGLAAGTYTIEATTFTAGQTGSFTLTVSGLGGSTTPPPSGDCEAAITADGTVSGAWAADCDSVDKAGSHARYYTFTLVQASDVTIGLESTIDTFLYLRGGEAKSGTALHEDDDGGEGTNSRIQADGLAAGTYTIEATTYRADDTGSFTLTVSGLGGSTTPPPSEDCETTITADGAYTGTWAAGCDSADKAGSHARYYTIELTYTSAVTVTLERTSGNADTYLNIWKGANRTGTPEAFNDDAPDISRSHIQATLAAGSYTIEATTFTAGQTGAFTLAVSGIETGTPAGDRAALVAFYNATGGPNWTDNSGWLTDPSIDHWYGVTTDDSGRVTELRLIENQLTGEIPAELGNLTSLTWLVLVRNQLSGEIPTELGNLTNLEALVLHTNQLSGEIPAELGNLTNLTIGMTLGTNQLTGEIPTALGNLTSAERLYLHQNQLTGEIPSELGNLTSVQLLLLHDNQLSGAIPSELGNLDSLQLLLLHDNQLSGAIPSELGSLTSLQRLDLEENQLSGQIPPELGNLTSLTSLDLSDNQLSEEISAALGDLTSLRSLNLGGNQLSGEIPAALGNLANLTSLALSANQLSGSIPSELGSLTNLTALWLWGNQLSGTIPSELGSLTNLIRLSLSGNQLSGSIPAELGNLTNLETLQLAGNQLTGCVPAGLRDVESNDFDALGLPFCGA